MYKILIPKALKESARTFLTDKGYELVELQGTDEETMKKAISDVDASLPVRKNIHLLSLKPLGTSRSLPVTALATKTSILSLRQKGVTVTLARGCNTYSVAEHAITLMLAALRQISQLDREVRKGDWKSRDRVETHEARGKVFGSIGIGPIGMEAVKIAHFGFQMKILVYDKFVDQSKFPDWIEFTNTLDDLMERSDVVSPHLPLNKGTFHILNEESISHMKRGGILLNVSRGAIWDEKAVYQALAGGTDRSRGRRRF